MCISTQGMDKNHSALTVVFYCLSYAREQEQALSLSPKPISIAFGSQQSEKMLRRKPSLWSEKMATRKEI